MGESDGFWEVAAGSPTPPPSQARLAALEALFGLQLQIDAAVAGVRVNPLEALDALKLMERNVAEARRRIQAVIEQDAPKGANLVILHKRRETLL